MRKRDLLARIEELERRVLELEARPQFSYTPYYPTTPYFTGPFPVITSDSVAADGVKVTGTTITTAPHPVTLTGAH